MGINNMKKGEALYQFFSSFGLNAYPSNSVPNDVVFPWMTFDNIIGNTGDAVSCNLRLYYHTESEAIPNNKVEQIATAIGMGGKVINYDDGAIWIKRGTPWCQSIADENDSTIKGRAISLVLEFM